MEDGVPSNECGLCVVGVRRVGWRCAGVALAVLLPLGTTGLHTALAQPRGKIVVTLPLLEPPAGGAEVSFTMSAPGGGGTPITLRDDGHMPDIAPEDGRWAGGGWFDPAVTSGVLRIGDHTYPPVALTFGAGAPENPVLMIELQDQLVQLVGNSGPAAGQRPDGPDNPLEAPGAGPMMGPGASAPGGTEVARTSSTGSWGPSWAGLAAFGLGSVVVIAVGLLWWTRPAAAKVRATRPANPLQPRPEAALVGSATPSLSDGLWLWVAPPEEVEALVAPLLHTVARERAVLVVAAPERVLPRVHGGPVYRARGLSAVEVRTSLDQLGGSEAVALFVLDASAESLVALGDCLPAGRGGLALCAASPELPALPRVDLRRDGGAWIVRSGRRGARLVEGTVGLVAVESAPMAR